MLSDGIEESAPKKRSRFLKFALLVVGVGLAVGIAFVVNRPANPLPPLSEIERMEVHVYDRDSHDYVTLQVPRSRWRTFYSAMLPASKDDHAKKMGGLRRPASPAEEWEALLHRAFLPPRGGRRSLRGWTDF
jgi:hypothetical protein